MFLMEFAEILAAQLLKIIMNVTWISTKTILMIILIMQKKAKKLMTEISKKKFGKYYHFDKKGVQHNLKKSGIRVAKNGKKCNKTNEYVVCKK